MRNRACCLSLLGTGVLLVALAVLCLRGLHFGPGGEGPPGATCLSNTKQLALGALDYTQEHGCLPPAARWDKVIIPYIRDKRTLICPASKQLSGPSYAMVAKWGGKRLQDVPDPATAILFYEIDHGRPVWRHKAPGRLLSWPHQPLGMNVSYVDGHARWTNRITAAMIADGRD